jgi:hypothetical protein
MTTTAEHFLTIIGFFMVVWVSGKVIAWFLVAIWEMMRRCDSKHMFHCMHYDGTESVVKDKGDCREPGSTKYDTEHCCRCKHRKIWRWPDRFTDAN